MNEFETLFHRHGDSLLDPEEKFDCLARLYTPTWSQRNFIGGVTAKRLVLVEVHGRAIGVRPDFVGLLDIPFARIESLITWAFLNQKRMVITFRSDPTLNLGLNSLLRTVPGQRRFVGALRSCYEHFKLEADYDAEPEEKRDAGSTPEATLSSENARKGERLGLGILAGLATSVLAAFAWAAITLATGIQIGWMAIALGGVVGTAVRLAGRGVDKSFRVIGALLAIMGCLLGNLLWVAGVLGQAANATMSTTLGFLARRPDLVFRMMVATSHPRDVTFYVLAAFVAYALAAQGASH